MRTAAFYIICTSMVLIAGTSKAAETFDMSLPDDQEQGSGGFYNSFQSGSPTAVSSSGGVDSVTDIPASRPNVVDEEEIKGAYENAFSSYRSKSSSESEVDPSEAWRQSQDKADNFDLDNLSAVESAPEPVFQKPLPPQKVVQRRTSSTTSKSTSNPRDEVEIPPPEGVDFNAEIERSTQPEQVESEAPVVSAKERKALVLRTIADNYGQLKSCYHEGLRKKAGMKGKVVMGWSMDSQGRVSSVEVRSSQLNNKQVEKCMTDRMASWRFPRQAKLSGSNDRMTYTFQFVPESE